MQKNSLPPIIMTSETSSFAQKTIHVRLPQILEVMQSFEDLSIEIRQEIETFRDELIKGRLQSIREQTKDKDFWNDAMNKWFGKKWDQLPWYQAEAFFYRRILEITRYFQPGPWLGKDPFERLKSQDISDGKAVFEDHYPTLSIDKHFEGFQDHIIKALWGNRGDLSFLTPMNTSMETQNHWIILDHTKQAYQYLTTNQSAKIAYFFDNVGKELFFDLALIDYLLQTGLADQVTCFIKNQPFFVSDVMEKDLRNSINLLSRSQVPESQQLANRLQQCLKTRKILIEAPPFLTQGLTFRQMPTDVYDLLKIHDLTLLKGDLNYRRLMGDRHWKPTTPVEIAGGYFPTSFVSLRTLKAELVVGLTDKILDRIEAEGDPHWMTNGKRGLITFRGYCGKKIYNSLDDDGSS